MNKAPLLFDDAQPTPDYELYKRSLEAQEAFPVKIPNAGQRWQYKVGTMEDGTPIFKPVTIIAVANTAPGSSEPPTVMYRNCKKELHSFPLSEWVDGDTFYDGQAKDR